MANTLNFNNIQKPTFERLIQDLAKALPGMDSPARATDGTLRGRAEHSGIAVNYVWDPNSSVLIMDIEKPFFVPFSAIQDQVSQIVNNARDAVLFGRV